MTKHAGNVPSRWAGSPFPFRDPGVLLKPKGVELALRIGAAGESWEKEPGGSGLPLAGVGRYKSQLGHCPPHRSGGSAPVWRTAGGSLGQGGPGRKVSSRLPPHPKPQLQCPTENGVSQASPSSVPSFSFSSKLWRLQGPLLHLNSQRLCLHPEPSSHP